MSISQTSPLARIKDEIRNEADSLRARTPHPTLPKSYPRPRRRADDERQRRDYTIDDLCRFPYTTFVDQAFRAVLKRPPDAAGFDAHVRLLMSGGSKIEVLGNLRYSGEGRAIGVRIPGLLRRYALSKAFRIPVLGYLVEWAVSLAALPKIVQHQRAMDIVHFARSFEIDAVVRALRVEVGALGDASERLSEQVLAGQARVAAQLALIQQGIRSELDALEARTSAPHAVLSMNHWMTELRRSLVAVEAEQEAQRAWSARLAAGISQHVRHGTDPRARHLVWLDAIVARVAPGSRVLDLGSSTEWVVRLAGAGFEVTAATVMASPGTTAVGRVPETPAAMLARAADASIDLLSVLAAGTLLSRVSAAALLQSARRILKPGALMVLAVEADEGELLDRLGGVAAPTIDIDLWYAALMASGFAEVTRVPGADGAECVFARNPC